jgi:hypothetical protein
MTSTGVSDSFASLFRNSRLAALPQPIKIPQAAPRTATIFANYPTHQVLTSGNATRSRGEWGLKRPMPSLKTKYVSVRKLDSSIHQTHFESANDKVKLVRRWSEARIPLTNSEHSSKLFSSSPSYKSPFVTRSTEDIQGPWLPTLSPRELRQVVTRARKLRGEYLQASGEQTSKEQALEYLKLPTTNTAYQTSPTAGLSYALPGAIPSTPQGVVSTTRSGTFKTPIPGRQLAVGVEHSHDVGLIGVVGKSLSPFGSRGALSRKNITKFIPASASIERDGTISLDVYTEADLERRKQRSSERSIPKLGSFLDSIIPPSRGRASRRGLMEDFGGLLQPYPPISRKKQV